MNEQNVYFPPKWITTAVNFLKFLGLSRGAVFMSETITFLYLWFRTWLWEFLLENCFMHIEIYSRYKKLYKHEPFLKWSNFVLVIITKQAKKRFSFQMLGYWKFFINTWSNLFYIIWGYIFEMAISWQNEIVVSFT